MTSSPFTDDDTAFSNVPTVQDLCNIAPAQGRLMGLDVGDKTIGVALSDPERTLASPLVGLGRHRQGWRADAENIAQLIQTHQVSGLVVGLPLRPDNTWGRQGEKILAFMAYADARWKDKTPPLEVPMGFWDERYSTAAVTNILYEAGLSRQKRAAVVDKMAAAYILQAALEAMTCGSS